MSGPVDMFGLDAIRRSDKSPKDKSAPSTNLRRWTPRVSFTVSSKPLSLFILQLPMYAVLFLAGFGNVTGFHLDVAVLTTLAGIAAASMFPYSISMAFRAIRESTSNTR